MTSAFKTFKLWQAKDLDDPGFGDAVRSIEDSDQIILDYCIPKHFTKRQADVTGVESNVGNYPDTGPAGAYIEAQITLNRQDSTPVFATILERWYYLINTDSPFKKGFLGLENGDNSWLNITPDADHGYKLIDFRQVQPEDYHGTQTYVILLQRGGEL